MLRVWVCSIKLLGGNGTISCSFSWRAIKQRHIGSILQTLVGIWAPIRFIYVVCVHQRGFWSSHLMLWCIQYILHFKSLNVSKISLWHHSNAEHNQILHEFSCRAKETELIWIACSYLLITEWYWKQCTSAVGKRVEVFVLCFCFVLCVVLCCLLCYVLLFLSCFPAGWTRTSRTAWLFSKIGFGFFFFILFFLI